MPVALERAVVHNRRTESATVEPLNRRIEERERARKRERESTRAAEVHRIIVSLSGRVDDRQREEGQMDGDNNR